MHRYENNSSNVLLQRMYKGDKMSRSIRRAHTCAKTDDLQNSYNLPHW